MCSRSRMVPCLSRPKGSLGTLSCRLCSWRGRWRVWPWLFGRLRGCLGLAHILKCTSGVLLQIRVGAIVLLRSWRHTLGEPGLISLRPRMGSPSRLVAPRRWRELVTGIGPRISSYARGHGVSRSSSAGIVLGFLLRVGEDFMRGLDNLELLVYFLLSTRVAIRMIFECKLPELLLDILDVGRGGQLQVRIIVSG